MASKTEKIPVVRHPFRGIAIYEVSGDDLDALERETSSISQDFSFGAVTLSVAVSFTITLLTTTIASNRVFEAFMIVVAVCYVAALFFGVRYFKSRKTL